MKRIPFMTPANPALARANRKKAMAALIYLKELPPETERQLLDLKNDPEPEVAVAADSILEKRNRNDYVCFPADDTLRIVDRR